MGWAEQTTKLGKTVVERHQEKKRHHHLLNPSSILQNSISKNNNISHLSIIITVQHSYSTPPYPFFSPSLFFLIFGLNPSFITIK